MHAKQNPGRYSAFTLLEIMIVICIIGLLAAVAIPNFIRVSEISQKNACVANLKAIDGAKNERLKQFVSDTNAAKNFTDADLFGPTHALKEKPQCPATTLAYEIGDFGQKPRCAVASHTF